MKFKVKRVTSDVGSSQISYFDCCCRMTLRIDRPIPAYLADLYKDDLPAKTSNRPNQFLSGRYAAHLALAQCSSMMATQPVIRGKYGEPIFPAGFVGSISHTREFATAIAASSSDMLAVGVDIENTDRTISPRLLTRIANPSDIHWTDSSASGSPDIDHEDREICQTQICDRRTIELFSMKESIYKAYFQCRHEIIAFKDICIYPTNSPNYFHAAIANNTKAHLNTLPDSRRLIIVFCNTLDNLTTSIAIIPL